MSARDNQIQKGKGDRMIQQREYHEPPSLSPDEEWMRARSCKCNTCIWYIPDQYPEIHISQDICEAAETEIWYVDGRDCKDMYQEADKVLSTEGEDLEED